ncbi:MAG TPA: polymer-forming cytoskeletal protein [Acidobacteriota bacterium]
MKSKIDMGTMNGFLDAGAEVNGEIHFRDTLRIDGKFHGKILSANNLIVGESAEIDAEIDVGGISISGKVSGTVRASQRLEILAKGRVFASLNTPCLIIEEGALFQGKCDMEAAPKPAPASSGAPPGGLTAPRGPDRK